MDKAIDIITYDSCLFSRSPAKGINGNASQCRIVIKYEDGTEQEIFRGQLYHDTDWRQKMKRQGQEIRGDYPCDATESLPKETP